MKLPKEITLSLSDIFDSWFDEELCERINNYLAEKYGYCNKGFNYTDEITITNIDWDTRKD